MLNSAKLSDPEEVLFCADSSKVDAFSLRFALRLERVCDDIEASERLV